MAASPFDELNERYGKKWTAIVAARVRGEERRRKLRALIEDKAGEIRSDMNFVAFGSLARCEWTSGSDLDWSLLVDGEVDAKDMYTAKRLQSLLVPPEWNTPGGRGFFASLAFSHTLVHEIGGRSDSPDNTTRRILLLLESAAIGDKIVRDRVIRALLERYLEEDTHFHASEGSRSFVPRFLLNDVVRYWRTIAVDYASKTQEHHRADWALRNIKLRFSRKLIFVSGLLMCFLCDLEHEAISSKPGLVDTTEAANIKFIAFLADLSEQTPLDVLASVVFQRKVSKKATEYLFDSYNQFLATLDNPESRARLKALTYEAAREDELFNNLRKASRSYQEGLRLLFFETDDELRRLAQIYAIF